MAGSCRLEDQLRPCDAPVIDVMKELSVTNRTSACVDDKDLLGTSTRAGSSAYGRWTISLPTRALQNSKVWQPDCISRSLMLVLMKRSDAIRPGRTSSCTRGCPASAVQTYGNDCEKTQPLHLRTRAECATTPVLLRGCGAVPGTWVLPQSEIREMITLALDDR